MHSTNDDKKNQVKLPISHDVISPNETKFEETLVLLET